MSAPPRKPPRWVRWTVVPLLVLVPIGYVVISAEQSRNSGRDKADSAAATGLTRLWPTKVQRRIYEVPIPHGSDNVGYNEMNSWKRSVLYVQFRTSAGGLDTFLAQVGTSRAALTAGKATIGANKARTLGWHFSGGGDWSGLSLHQPGAMPDRAIMVDLGNPDHPFVYVASTVNSSALPDPRP